ncbi:hypothetical protein NO2_1011 [Candidatus Termititenax persephonae]|uniref:Uncharacterized protein n=1 Tax=Candidatus Termititenax persephonae TaxID=2218525 RepID=A0A388TI85_9BACT|nr:hypothetical protein NO2_1011 [Candidatus Termititenax persephonae]
MQEVRGSSPRMPTMLRWALIFARKLLPMIEGSIIVMSDIMAEKQKRRAASSANKEIYKWYGWGTPLGLSIVILSSSLALCMLTIVACFATRYL